MRPRAMPLLLVLGLLALAPAPALAHGGGHGFVQANLAGPYLVTATTGSELPVNGTALPFNFIVQEAATRKTLENRSLVLNTSVKGGAAIEDEVVATALRGFPGVFAANLTFPRNGTHMIGVRVMPEGAMTNFTIEVYPALPYRVDYLPGGIAYAGKPAAGDFILSTWPEGRPFPGVADASALVEEWTFDHGRKLGEVSVPLKDTGTGIYAFTYSFPKESMYHIWFVAPSLGIEPYGTPMAHVQTYPSDEAPPTKPAWALPAIGALLALGLAAIGLGRRR